jgi:DNA-binding SARP family transcriptional activator
MRIYLTGRVGLEAGDRLIGGRDFPGRQGRLMFAYLTATRLRPATRDEIAEILWPGALPARWEVALSALVSKLRALMRGSGLAREAASIESHIGGYHLAVSPGAWVDVEAAARAIDEAEGALRAGHCRTAWGHANVAVAIARRTFLPGDEDPWIDSQRRRLHEILVRGLDCLSELSLQNGEVPLAVQHAAEAVTLEPFRETGYQRLMRAHAAAGNRAEAIRVYERCRALLAEELGAAPSPQTEAAYRGLLREG